MLIPEILLIILIHSFNPLRTTNLLVKSKYSSTQSAIFFSLSDKLYIGSLKSIDFNFDYGTKCFKID